MRFRNIDGSRKKARSKFDEYCITEISLWHQFIKTPFCRLGNHEYPDRATAKVIDAIVSTSTSSDFETYLIARKRLTRYYPNARIWVVVPDADYQLFLTSIPAENIIRDSELISRTTKEQIQALAHDRANWYLQQFLKLAFLFMKADEYQVAMIWDADTVQRRRIDHFMEDSILYGAATESHSEYFDAIYRVLQLDKQVQESFIAQYMVLRKGWMVDLCSALGGLQNWLDCLISGIKFSDKSGFSEYELIGTFVINRYPKQFLRNQTLRIERYGNSRFGGIRSFNRGFGRILSLRTHVIAFEKWDPVARNPFRKNLWRVSIGLLRKSRKLLRTTYLSRRFARPLDFDSVTATSFDESGELTDFLAWVHEQETVRVIQVGANDGVQNDFLNKFIALNVPNVQYTLIEPIRHYYNSLASRYRSIVNVEVINAAIGQTATIDLYYIRPEVADEMNGDGPLNNWAHGQGSRSRAKIIQSIFDNSFRGPRYVAQIPRFINAICQESVRCAPLSDFVSSKSLNLVILDVQGMEIDVLRTLDLSSLPDYVIVEDEFEDNRLEVFLTNLGYQYVLGIHDKLFQNTNSPIAYKPNK